MESRLNFKNVKKDDRLKYLANNNSDKRHEIIKDLMHDKQKTIVKS